MLVNNTLVPIKVTVESMFSTSGGSLQFTDVLPTDKDWTNLNVADSKQYIALGIRIPSALEWNAGYDTSTHYAAEMSLVEFGTLKSSSTGVLTWLLVMGSHLMKYVLQSTVYFLCLVWYKD